MTDFPCCLCGENGGTWVCRIDYEMTKTRFYTTPRYFLTFSSGIFEKAEDNCTKHEHHIGHAGDIQGTNVTVEGGTLVEHGIQICHARDVPGADVAVKGGTINQRLAFLQFKTYYDKQLQRHAG